MICAICEQELEDNGVLGYVHPDGARFGPDGHDVVPVLKPPRRLLFPAHHIGW